MIFNMVGSSGGSGDLSNVTATAGDVRENKVFVNSSGNEVTGTLTDNGAYSGIISDTNALSIPNGIHSGSTARISQTERAKIIPSNIVSGVTILGVAGSAVTSGYAINGVEYTATDLVGANVGDIGYYVNVDGDIQYRGINDTAQVHIPCVVTSVSGTTVTIIAAS